MKELLHSDQPVVRCDLAKAVMILVTSGVTCTSLLAYDLNFPSTLPLEVGVGGTGESRLISYRVSVGKFLDLFSFS